MNTPNSHDGNAPEARTSGETTADSRDAENARLRAEHAKWRNADAQWRSQHSTWTPERAESAVAEVDRLRAEVEGLRKTGLRHLDYFKAMRERRASAEARADAAEAERDRARNLAASLEAECARLTHDARRVVDSTNGDLHRNIANLRAALTAPNETKDQP